LQQQGREESARRNPRGLIRRRTGDGMQFLAGFLVARVRVATDVVTPRLTQNTNMHNMVL
jgi:hypothetical protein